MRRTFNCGVGLILIVDPHDLPDVLDGLLHAGEEAFVCGELAAALGRSWGSYSPLNTAVRF